MKFSNGLSFFDFNTNWKGFNVASYHHPNSLTWRWVLSYYAPCRRTAFLFPKFINLSRGRIRLQLTLPLLGCLVFNTQDHCWKNKQ